MWRRLRYQMGTENWDAYSGEEKGTQEQFGIREGTHRRGRQKSAGTERKAVNTVPKLGNL